MSRVFCKIWWKLNIFPYLIDFLPFLLQVLSLYVYAILLKEFRHSMILGKSNTKVSEKYCQAPVSREIAVWIKTPTMTKIQTWVTTTKTWGSKD